MYPIIRKQVLNETTTLMEIEAPLVARKAKPGQFIILRVDEEGERIPLTIAGTDPDQGTVKTRKPQMRLPMNPSENVSDHPGFSGHCCCTETIISVDKSVPVRPAYLSEAVSSLPP